MADVLFIGMMIAFFALAVGLVRICDRIIGADDEVVVGAVQYPSDPDTTEGVAA